jgi:hypothetical protein
MFDLSGMTALVTAQAVHRISHCDGVGWAGARVALSGTREEALRTVGERLVAIT